MKIKNWKKFQHFKDRRPPWVKLHREILEQRDINLLSDRSFRVLVLLWLLASEDETLSGSIPSIEDIAYRTRMKETDIIKSLQELKSFIEEDDINMISGCYRLGLPEAETEAYKEEAERELEKEKKRLRESKTDSLQKFETFWDIFNYKRGRDGALKSWNKIKLTDSLFNDILNGAAREAKNRPIIESKGNTPKMAQGWLTEKRWEDDHVEKVAEPVKKKSNIDIAFESLYGEDYANTGMVDETDETPPGTIDVTPPRLLS